MLAGMSSSSLTLLTASTASPSDALGRQIEGEGDDGELALMIHGDGDSDLLHVGKGAQGNLAAGGEYGRRCDGAAA